MKRYLALLLVLLTVATLALASAPNASAESLYIRKIVSVVYDDSGSMKGAKHAYANYAMQTFCGMLNSEDQLYITKMSDSKCRQIDLSATGIQSSVNTIRKYGASGGTPFGAVTTAFNKLKSVQDDNPNTQYWLVVISDGNFISGTDGASDDAGKRNFLNQKMQEYTQTVMPNGSYPQVNFLAIGDSVIAPDKNEKQGIYTYHAQTADEITDEMASMADRISGRTRLATADIKQLDDRTIQVSSSIPLLNIAVLAQGSGAAISGAVDSGGASIPISRSASLVCPDTANYPDLMAGAYLLGDSQDVIEAGTYTITFDRSISLSDVVVLYEPALEVRVSIRINGQEITDIRQLEEATEGDKISVSYNIYEMGTDRQIDPALLPANTQYEATITENGQEVARADGNREIAEYELKNAETELRVAVTIAGFNPITYTTRFTPRKFVLYTVGAEFVGTARSVKLDEIGSNRDLVIRFTVYGNGVPVTDTEAVKALAPSIAVSPQGNGGSIEYTADGQILFTPNAAKKPDNCYDQFAVNVTCTLSNGMFATKTYTVELPQYTLETAYGGGQSVKYDELAQNKDMTVLFTVRKDGVAITDPEEVKALSPTVTAAPGGNSGTVTYTADGKIVFTPNAAAKPEGCFDQFDVTVTCTIAPGASASATYTVVLPAYTMEAALVGQTQSVKFDEIFQNQDLAIRFTVFKDGVAITDPEELKALQPALAVSPQGNSGTVEYTSDGKLLFTPNVAVKPADCGAQFDVTVTCSIAQGASASATYTVVLPVYTLEVAFGGPAQSVKFDEIASNQELTLLFTVYKDGVAVTDSNAVKALNPIVSASPNGNSGIVTVTEDGKILFTPNAAALPVAHDGHFSVEVTCTIDGGISAKGSYTVLIAEYKVIAVPSDGSIIKTRFFGNEIGASFYITKDGVSLSREALGQQFAVTLNKAHEDLLTRVEISEDGIITVVPYSDEDRPLNFWNWIRNPRYYWCVLSGEDVQITLSHPVGYGVNTLDVCGETSGYIWANVIAPLILNLVMLWCIVMCFIKPRYAKGAMLCVGKIQCDFAGRQSITNFRPARLTKFNKFFKLKNRRWVPWPTAQKMSVRGLGFRAVGIWLLGSEEISYEMSRPWFKANIEPSSSSTLDSGDFEALRSYFAKNGALEIEDLRMPEGKQSQQSKILSPVPQSQVNGCMVCPGTVREDGKLESGWVFVYYKEEKNN